MVRENCEDAGFGVDVARRRGDFTKLIPGSVRERDLPVRVEVEVDEDTAALSLVC